MVNVIGRRVDITPIAPTQAPSNIGTVIAQLGDRLFGDTLTPELKRRQAEKIGLDNLKSRREYDSTGQLATQAGDPNTSIADLFKSMILAGQTPAQAGDLLRVRAANLYGAGDDRATNSFVGAGGAYGSTVAGSREADASKEKIAQMQADRQAASQVRVAGLTPVEAVDQSGAPTWTTRADIANGGAAQKGLTPVLSTDQVVGSTMQRSLSGQPQAAPSPNGAPAGPVTDPFENLPPSIKKKAGLLVEPRTFIHPQSNAVATSFDGGLNGVTSSGDFVPLRVGGWVPTGPETAVSESRQAQLKAQAARGNPNLTQRDPLTGDIARSAYKATGVDAFGQEHANALLGSLGITRLFGAGEVGPEYERARDNLNVFRQTAKSAFVNSPTFPIKEQRLIDEMLPGPAMLANPESQARKVGTVFNWLKADNERLRRVIVDSTDPAAANRANQALIDNEKVLGMLTRGTQSTGRGPAGSASPGAQQPIEFVRGPDGRIVRR